MNEKKQFKEVLIKLVIISVCAVCYCLGGAEFGPGKWIRRIAMPLIMGGSMYWYTRDWRSLITIPGLAIGTSLGYGADTEFLKILKRTYCGLFLGVASASEDLLNKRFVVSLMQVVFVTAGMILLGVYNIMPDARTEEFCIGFLIAFFPIMSARRIV